MSLFHNTITFICQIIVSRYRKCTTKPFTCVFLKDHEKLYMFCFTSIVLQQCCLKCSILFRKFYFSNWTKARQINFHHLKKQFFYIIKMLSQMKLEHVFIYILYLLCNRYYIPRYMYLFYRKKVPRWKYLCKI